MNTLVFFFKEFVPLIFSILSFWFQVYLHITNTQNSTWMWTTSQSKYLFMLIPNCYHCVQLKCNSYNSSQLQVWQGRGKCGSMRKTTFTLFFFLKECFSFLFFSDFILLKNWPPTHLLLMHFPLWNTWFSWCHLWRILMSSGAVAPVFQRRERWSPVVFLFPF